MNRLAMMVVTWNNADDALECLESLQKQTVKNIKLLIVDNNSEQKTQQILKDYQQKHSSTTVYIQTGYNGGTAGGFSAGAQWAINNDYEFIGTLNADAIADRVMVAALLQELQQNPKAGVATGQLLRRDGKTIDTTGDFYTTWGLPSPRLRDQPVAAAPQESGEIFGSSGGMFLARTALFKAVGLYDPTFFMYFEDVDLAFRAQLQGWQARYTPKAIAYHKLGASSATVPGLAVYNTFKNLPLLFIKNVPLQLWPTIWPRFALMYALIFASAFKKGRGCYALKGWLKHFILLPHAFKARRAIQKKRTVTINYLHRIILRGIPPEQTGLRRFRRFFIKYEPRRP